MNVRERSARAVLRAIPRIGRFLDGALERLPDSLSLLRLRILRRLADHDARNVELAATAAVTAPTMSGAIDQLVKAGWVARDADPADRRAVVLRITPDGRRVLDEAERALVALLAARFEGVD